MKIGVIGIGAVGGYFGAKLAHAGQDVTFIGTESSVSALKEKGLCIKSYQGDFEIKNPKVAHDFRRIADCDIILFCLKSYNTEEVAKALKPKISEHSLIISMQNGVENEEILSKIFGPERVIGAVVYITSSVPEKGVIKHTGYGKVVFGELTGEITDRLRKIEKLFIDSNIPAGISTDIKKDLWKKLILNTAYNGFTSIIKKPLVKFHDIPEAEEMFIKVLKEGQMVAQKEGLNITDKDIEDLMKVTKTEAFVNFKTSTLQDIEAGKPIEIDSLQGAVIKAAQKHNVDVPLNKLMYALLKLKY